jgi:hypothetical protein
VRKQRERVRKQQEGVRQRRFFGGKPPKNRAENSSILYTENNVMKILNGLF